MIKKIDVKIEDLSVDEDIVLQKRIKKSYDFARVFIWLGIKFINEKKRSITTKELSDCLIQNYTYTYNLLYSFIELKILKKIKTSSKETVFVCINEEVFNHYIELAKSIVNGRNG